MIFIKAIQNRNFTSQSLWIYNQWNHFIYTFDFNRLILPHIKTLHCMVSLQLICLYSSLLNNKIDKTNMFNSWRNKASKCVSYYSSKPSNLILSFVEGEIWFIASTTPCLSASFDSLSTLSILSVLIFSFKTVKQLTRIKLRRVRQNKNNKKINSSQLLDNSLGFMTTCIINKQQNSFFL